MRSGRGGSWWRTITQCGVLLALVACWACAPKPPPPQPIPATADLVVLKKAKRRLYLVANGHVLRVFRVALGPSPAGHKMMEGDGRTPEGRYLLDYRNAYSRYHLSLHVSYPNEDDRVRAETMGVAPGGDIMIHGLPNDRGYWGPAHAERDWTAGCIAVTNEEIEDIWNLVPDGTPIEIEP